MGSISHVSRLEVKHGSSNIYLKLLLLCLTFDPDTYKWELTFISYSKHFGALNVEISKEMAKLVKLTSNIDLDLLASVFDL